MMVKLQSLFQFFGQGIQTFTREDREMSVFLQLSISDVNLAAMEVQEVKGCMDEASWLQEREVFAAAIYAVNVSINVLAR
ncbi:hypothetical protein GN956_G6146 [Arapaima gigas]